MNHRQTRLLPLLLLLLALCAGCAQAEETRIVLSDDGVTVDGAAIGRDGGAAVFASHDIIYYEDRETYESGNPYGEGTEADRHSAEEAAAHTVVNITQPGVYRLTGSLSAGQIRVDLGEDAKTDPSAVVTLVLDNADVTCTVAPAVLFLNVYECDHGWSAETAGSDVDTSAAGANVELAPGSVNTISGAYVARIYQDAEGEQKLWKQDGAFYSYMSMNVSAQGDESGLLTIVAENEGLDTELHLTINSGSIRIFSQDDGINTNEDGVSVTTMNGGDVHIVAGLGQEGDGVDSNGWLVINGGTVIASANPAADAGLDADMGSFVNGGTVVALGSTMDWAESDSRQTTLNLQFAGYNDSGDAIVLTDLSGRVVFAYDPSEDEVVGNHVRRYRGAVISSPALQVNESYHVYIGGEVTGEEAQGVYRAETVTAYGGGAQQVYTGTDVTRFGHGGFGEPGEFSGRGGMNDAFAALNALTGEEKAALKTGRMPETLTQEELVDLVAQLLNLLDGFSGDAPQGGEPGFGRGEQPMGMPGEGMGPGGGAPGAAQQTGEGAAEFFLQDKVNCYSGVSAR